MHSQCVPFDRIYRLLVQSKRRILYSSTMIITQLNTLLQFILGSYGGDNTNCAIVITNTNHLFLKTATPMIYLERNTSGGYDFLASLEQTMKYGCQIFVMYVDDPLDVVNDLEEAVKVTDRRFGRRKLVFIADLELPVEESREQLLNVLQHSAFEFVPDVLLILPVQSAMVSAGRNSTLSSELFLPEKHTEFELITHQYVGASNHHEPVTIDFWNTMEETFTAGNNLFPDKMNDYHGRILRMASFSYPPYVIKDGDTYDGMEMRFAVEYARELNATIDIVDVSDGEWGMIFENRTGYGLIGTLVEDKAEIGFAALYSWFHEYGFLDFSVPSVRTGVTCLSPAPRLLTSWLTPLIPFTAYVWLGLFVTEILAVLAMKFISTKSNQFPNRKPAASFGDADIFTREDISNNDHNSRQDDAENWVIFTIPQGTMAVVSLLLLQPFPASMSALSASLKHLLLWLLVLSLLVTSSYSGGLSSSMTIPRYEDSIKTVQDLADYRMEWGASSDAWLYSIADATEPAIIQLRTQFRMHEDQELRRRAKTRDFAFSLERLPYGHFAIGPYITAEALPYLQAMSEDIYWEQCVVMMRKSSPHLEGVNALIGKLHAAGLMGFWEGEVARKYLDYKVQLGVKLSLMDHGNQDADAPVKLRTSHLKGMYVMWAFGIIISCICFIVELATDLYNKIH